MVIGYRVGALTAWIARRYIKVDYFTLINLILKRRAIPELLQEECTPERLAAELVQLFTNPTARIAQVTSSAEAIKALGLGDEKPSTRSARAILNLIREPRTPQKKEAAPKDAAPQKN
jgi:lipid-A-disaccharide synthase